MKISALLLGTLIVSANAYALIPADKVQENVQKHSLLNSYFQCADFSGSWHGKCDGDTDETYIVIGQHECSFITVNGTFFAIGGTRTESHVIPQPGGDISTSNVTNTSWNADKSALNTVTDAFVYEVGKGYTYVDHMTGTSRLVNGKIVSTYTTKAGPGSCVYAKIP